MFKECLRYNLMPFILDDKRRGQYLEGLRNWNNEHDTLIAVVKDAQNRLEQQISQHILRAQGQRFLPKDLIEEEKNG